MEFSIAPEAQVQLVTQMGIIITLLITFWMNRKKTEEVAKKVEDTKAVTNENVAKLQVVADATHLIVNSRYDELKNELVKSNQRVESLLQSIAKERGEVRPEKVEQEPSSVVSASIPNKRTDRSEPR